MRFSESAWINKPLRTFTEKITTKNKDLKVTNVISNSANLGLISQTDYFDKEIANQSNIDGYYIINKGDFVYNPRKSKGAPYGPINIYRGETTGVVSPLYLCFKVNSINKKFLYYYFKGNSWHRYIYLNGDSGARSDRVSIKDDVFFNIPIRFPDDSNQKIIANFFDLIEDRINTQIKIISDYGSLKDGIYHLIFRDKNNEFKLKALAQIVKGIQINNDQLLQDGLYYMMNGGTFPSGYLNTYNVMEDTISISEGGNSCGYVQFNKTKFWSGGHCYTIQNVNSSLIENKYLYHYLKYKEKDIMNLRIGTGLPNIQKKDLENFMIPVPSLSIQRKDLALLEILDQKIYLLNQELKYLEKQKLYLLRNMFI